LGQYGLVPLNLKGLIGIFTSPFLHADFKHLVSNCVPLFFLGSALFFFYKEFAYQALLIMYLLTGLATWMMGRGDGVHIGASGIVYALIFFHLTSALLRQRKDLTSFSFVVILLYGSVFWGFFPDFFPDRNISWEGHLSGAIVGVVLAFYYRKLGPQKIVHVWDDEDDENEDEFDEFYELYNNYPNMNNSNDGISEDDSNCNINSNINSNTENKNNNYKINNIRYNSIDKTDKNYFVNKNFTNLNSTSEKEINYSEKSNRNEISKKH
jgi:membrane associated rhomboid family serine protease